MDSSHSSSQLHIDEGHFRASSQFEDADDEWMPYDDGISMGGQEDRLPREGQSGHHKDSQFSDYDQCNDTGMTVESDFVSSSQEDDTQMKDWCMVDHSAFLDADCSDADYNDYAGKGCFEDSESIENAALSESNNVHEQYGSVEDSGNAVVHDQYGNIEDSGNTVHDQYGNVEDLDTSEQWQDAQEVLEETNNPDSSQEVTGNEKVASIGEGASHKPEASSESDNTVKQNATDADSSVIEPPANDDSLALVLYEPPAEPEESLSPRSPCGSPPVSPPLRQSHDPTSIPHMAASATGIPLHTNPLGFARPRLVQVHPLHIAAAVAAQRSRAAAMVQQQTRFAAAAAARQQAAAAVHQQAAAAAHQQAAAAAHQQAVHQQAAAVHQQAVQQQQAAAVHQQQQAAAVHQRQQAAAAARQHAAVAQRRAAAVAAAAHQQRSRATLMHQQLVRSRYMGAPVLVRQPFVPVPGVPAPIRLRMRLRRSVMMTEELNLDHA